jgi:hypothetical protein
MQWILRGLVVVLLILLPEPAAGAPGAPTLEARLGQITVAPGGPVKTTLLWLQPSAVAGTTRHFTLMLDFGPVAAFAEVEVGFSAISVREIRTSSAEPDGPCGRTTTTVVCTWDGVVYANEGLYPVGYVTARPKAAARTGDSGEIAVTGRVDAGPATTTTSALRVGAAVDLAAVAGIEVTARPGATATAAPMVRNTGKVATGGAVMLLDADPRLVSASSHRNCRYSPGTTICLFDTPLAPGRRYAVSEPLRLHPPADSVPGSRAHVYVQWMTPTEWSDWTGLFPETFFGRPGTGPPLALTMAATALEAPQADVRPENDSAPITLTVAGAGHPDLAAIGARLSATVGEDVAITVGLRNLGPGTLHPDLYANNQVSARIELPGAVTATEDLPECGGTWDGEKMLDYSCAITVVLPPGRQAGFTIPARVGRSRDRTGRVEVVDVLPAAAGQRATGQRNNVAPIVIEVAGADLPITGPGPVGLGGAGLALIAIGLLAVRRLRNSIDRPAGQARD